MASLTAYQMLVNAAKIVEKQRRGYLKGIERFPSGGCDAIVDAAMDAGWFSDGSFDQAQAAFRMMKPTKTNPLGFWWGDPAECSDEDHNARIIGLLLAAEIVR